jgi:hypothetical protein
MKKSIIALSILLLFPMIAFAGGKGVGFGVAGSGCTPCTDGLTFAAYFNDNTGDVTLGNPCGCSTGNSTGTANDSCTIHDGYLDSAYALQYFFYDGAILDSLDTEGSTLLDVRVDTWVDDAKIFELFGSASNYINIALYSSNDLRIWYNGNGSMVSGAITNNNQMNTSTRYYIIVRWTQSDVDPNIAVFLYNASENQLDTGIANNALTDWSTEPTELRIGNSHTTKDAAIRIYSIKVWDTYDGATF